MDLVINHSSTSMNGLLKQKSKENPYHDYYIWVDAYLRKNRMSGNRFLVAPFGNMSRNQQYYLALFFAKEQPDLNWESTQLKNELFTMIRWWLDQRYRWLSFRWDFHVKR